MNCSTRARVRSSNVMAPTAWCDLNQKRYGAVCCHKRNGLPQTRCSVLLLKNWVGIGICCKRSLKAGRWVIRVLRFQIQLGPSRHVGIFPEQACQWDWVSEHIQAAGRPLRVLNLFGYTGLASLAAAQAGAQVTHVDASRKVITWARQNQALSALEDRPIRWIVDDALKFVQREARRDARYDGLILDPPKFGRGPKGEVWEFYRLIPELLAACRQVMSPQARFVVLTAYAVKASALTLHYAMREMMGKQRGEVSAGEVVLSEKSAGRAVSMAIFARWSGQ
jgi:23S rRNA (cytosine1962-C5)-methyltransferase